MNKVINGRLALLVLVPAILLLTFFRCEESDASSTPTPSNNEVWMQGNAFMPGSITVIAGTTITYRNKHNVEHSITSIIPGTPDGIFDADLDPGESTAITFSNAGTFHY